MALTRRAVRPVRRRKTSSSGAATDQDLLRAQAAVVDRDGGRVTVVGVQQQPVGQRLDAVGEAVESTVEAGHVLLPQPQLQDLAGGVLLDERPRRALRHDAAPCP